MAKLTATLFVDSAPGETRRLLTDDKGRAFRLDLACESSRDPRIGEIWMGRLTGRMPGSGDWFVDLGAGPPGVLAARNTGPDIHEGALVRFRVRAESWSGKGPLLVRHLARDGAGGAAREPGRVHPADADAFLGGVEMVGKVEGQPARRRIDEAIEEATAGEVALAGGGVIHIDITRALTAVDVDSSGRRGQDGAARSLQALNIEAAETAVRQAALRSLGGLMVIDFIGARQGGYGPLLEALRSAAKLHFGSAMDVEGVSQLGLGICRIERGRRTLETALAAPGQAGRAALDLLRQVEDLGISERGRLLAATAPRDVIAWLEANRSIWLTALESRIGPRTFFAIGEGIDVRIKENGIA